jgi:hypothetical protein
MHDGQRFIGFAFLFDPVGPVVHSLIGPIVFFPLRGLPGPLGRHLPGGDQHPQRGHVQKDPIDYMGGDITTLPNDGF